MKIFFVRCGQCEAAGPYGETEEEALEAWNNRNDKSDDIEKLIGIHHEIDD